MNVLITGSTSPLGTALAADLASAHRLRLADQQPPAAQENWLQSALDHDESTDALVAGIDAIVHLPGPDPEADAAAWLDSCTRGTYNLLHAAAEAGVQKLIYLSSLELFDAYGDDVAHSPLWRPRPSDDPRLLGLFLGEFAAREFAREQRLSVLLLRIGHLLQPDQAPDPRALDLRDAVGAVAAAIEQDLPTYGVVHLSSGSRPMRGRRRRLNYQLQYPFEESR